MHLPLADWTSVKEVAGRTEGFDLEKKASAKFDPENQKGATQLELAKQVCAFANASNGVLMYGIANDGTLDAGILEAGSIGGQSRTTAKAWLEQCVPRPVNPAPPAV